MTIWLLALILLGCLAAVGYNQGAIRVGISFFGIIIAAVLAVPLARLVKPALSALGVSNPVLLWALAPFIVFVVINAGFKVLALTVHKKVDVYYKYKSGDLRQALFERLNSRLGACLGLLNGLTYLVLISWVVFAFGYWTTQMASGDEDPKRLRLLNRLGQDLEITGMSKAARAIDSLPATYYEAADFAGVLYHNPMAEARLSRYPGLFTLGERPEFQSIAQDKGFSELRVKNAGIGEVLANSSVQAITQNPDMIKLVWNTVVPDLKDLTEFLDTGISKRYDDRILGRWVFDVNAALMAFRKSKPNTPTAEMQRTRVWMQQNYARTILMAAPDGSIVVKNFPQQNAQGGADMQNLQGKWKSSGSDYLVSIGNLGERKGKIEGGRLVMGGEAPTLAFLPED